MRILRDDSGQITVFLALLFLVTATVLLCVLDGVRIYLNEGLCHDALRAAGREVSANYSAELYGRYHLFFLDPREQNYIVSDGEQCMNDYLQQMSGVRCEQITLTDQTGILEEDCKVLKEQIKEYVIYQKIAQEKEKLQKLVNYANDTEEKAERELEEIKQLDEGFSFSSDAEESQEEEAQTGDDMAEQDLAAKQQDKIQWNDFKQLLKSIFHSGILLYMTDDREVSNLAVDKKDSISSGISEQNASMNFNLSFDNIRELMNLLDNQREEDTAEYVVEDAFLLAYQRKHFRCWSDTSWKDSTALSYELEYMVSGKKSDRENLKSVAEKIFLSRFVTNYAYIQSDGALCSRAEEIALAISSAVGVPEVEKAIKQILLAALSCGEALLDVHTLFAGKKIPFVKTSATWTLTFENAVEALKEKRIVAEGNRSIQYRDYLILFQILNMGKTEKELRMADLMQWNIQLDRSDFQLADCIGTFSWEAQIQCVCQYPNPFGDGVQFVISKEVSY